MRVLSGLFSMLLIVFALVQYNDPDFIFWFVIYGLAAVLCGLAAFKPQLFTDVGALRGLLALSLIGAASGTVYYWPSDEAWWTKEVIWDNEMVREGLGMAIVMLGLVLAGLAWWRSGRALQA